MSEIKTRTLVDQALDSGRLSADSHKNLVEWLQPDFLPEWALQALCELVAAGEWTELNDRFFRPLDFGTAGLRGLTVGRVVAPTELGRPSPLGTPEHPAVGANNLNDFTVARATIGFFRYVKEWLKQDNNDWQNKGERSPRLVIAYDVRHFSRHFCELAANLWTLLGGEAFIFDGPRSTPQLSFTVRHLCADAGIVVTASHNPPPYNGFKVYFNDGAQVTPPHDKGIIKAVDGVRFAEIPGFLREAGGAAQRVKIVSPEVEAAYLTHLGDNVLDAGVIARAKLSVVYTNIHGTGDVMILPALKHFGADVRVVEEQRAHDPRFPTVKSPNPENAEAFELGLAEARRAGADIVIGTDPDDDRMGAVVRERDGSYRLLTGNIIGSLLAAYRVARFKELGFLKARYDLAKVAFIKSFVTSPLIDAIAAAEGICCVNTLTGFKWIGAKLLAYEARLRRCFPYMEKYDNIPWRERIDLHLQGDDSRAFIFGGEESYGYLGTDGVRDKDANAATLMIVELASWLKERDITVTEYLDQLYLRHGYYAEGLVNIVLEGADGAHRIRRIVESLSESPLRRIGGADVASEQDFSGAGIPPDADGDPVPEEKFYIFTLTDGRRFAIRASGTEPKMKYYLFANAPVKDPASLPAVKKQVEASLKELGDLLREDALKRAGISA